MLYHCLVLGAGASGLFYAATRKPQGSVLLLDHQERPGRKLLLSGGGKCNLTNRMVSPQNYLGGQPDFTRPALALFGPKRMLDFADKHGLEIEEREFGQIFLRSGAEKLRDLLLRLAVQNSAELALGRRIDSLLCLSSVPHPVHKAGGVSIEATAALPEGARFCIESSGKKYFGKNLLLATGGPAWPKAGASRLGQLIAQRLGHRIIETRPALTPLKMPQSWPLHGLQGLSLTATASTAQGGPAFTCPLLFTHSGISGPACLQISSYLKQGDEIMLDFLPGQSFSSLLDAPGAGKSTPLRVLRAHLPERLARALLSEEELAEMGGRKCAEISRAGRKNLHAAVHGHRARPLAPTFNQAESSSGGVDTSQISPKTMQSHILPGLYFAGEIMDVCGQLGGYNLHWAWASAWCAGQG